MEKESWGWGGIGFLALFFLIIIAFWGRGGNGFGWGNNGFATGALLGADLTGLTNSGYQNYKQTCDAEKSQIIDTARTQYLTEQQSAQTRELINSTASATQARIDFYQYQGLRDTVAERDRTITELKNMLFVKDQLAPVNAALASIQCNMLTKPQVTGLGVVNPTSGVINGLGIGSPLAALAGYNGYGYGYNGCCGGNNVLV